MIIAGIDFSLVSPGICIFSGIRFSFLDCKFHFLYTVRKFEECANKFIRPSPYPEWRTQEKRFDNLSEWVLKQVKDCEHVCLEGYSMASKGRVFDIAEATGLLKHKLWKSGIKCHIVPPTTLKKYASGKGNAKKNLMEKVFFDETKMNIRKILRQTEKQENPSSDLIDSYFLCKYCYEFCLEQ